MRALEEDRSRSSCPGSTPPVTAITSRKDGEDGRPRKWEAAIEPEGSVLACQARVG